MSSRPSAPADGAPPASGAGGTGAGNGGTEATAVVASAPLASPIPRAIGRRAGALAASGARGVGRTLRTIISHPVWPRAGRLLVRLALALAVLALVTGLLVRFVLWPQAHAAREWIEQRGSSALSAQLTIGQLDTYWDGWHPAFRARDVRAVDGQQRVLLAAGTLDGTLSWQSLAGLNLQFASLTAGQTDVLVRRTAEDRLLVAGVPVDMHAGAASDDRFLDWLLAQGSIELASGSLRWLDEKSRLPQLDVADIHFSTRRAGSQHSVRLEARSASLAPQPLVLQATLRHDYLHGPGNWKHWAGQASWDLGQLQLPVVQRYLAIFDKVASGTFSTDGTIDFRGGRVLRSQLRLRASGVDLQLSGAPEPLKLSNAQALLLHKADRAGNNSLTIDTLLWQGEPQAGPPSATDSTWREGMRKVTVGWTRDDKGEWRKFSLKAPTFDLNTVRALAASLPLDTAVLRQLRTLQPAGHIDNLDVTWSRDRIGVLDRRAGKAHYAVQGTLRGVSVNGQPAVPAIGADGHPRVGTPGFSRLSGNFSFDERQGNARVDSTGAAITFPGLFEEPRVPFDELSGEVRWTHEGDKLVVRTEGLRFANADTAGVVRGNWRAGGDGHSGIADLSGELARAKAERVPRYLPLSMPQTRHYLGGALVGGEANDVSFLVKGDLFHFPFHAPFDKAGDFRVEVPVQRVAYQIAPHESGPNGGTAWPDFTDIDGHVLFERGGMSFLARHATVRGVAGVMLQDVNGRIDDLSDHGHLVVDGTGNGAVQGFLKFIATSPVKGWTANVTENARAQGNGELKLKLDLPMSHAAGAKVDGQFRFPGNDIVLAPQLPPLGGASGVVAFNEHGFRLDNLRARFLGGETHIAGGTQPDSATRVTVGGTASAGGVREALAGSALAGLAGRLEGNAPYSAVIGVREKHLQVQVASELAGMAVTLPAPLAKTAGQELPLRFELRPSTTPGRAGLDEMVVQYGNVLNARYLLRRNGDAVEVVSGGIGLHQAAPQPASGVTAALSAERLDVDAWRAAASALGDAANGGDGGDGGNDNGGGAPGPAAVDRGSPFLPERVTVRARTLDVFGRGLDDVSLDATREGTGWNADMTSRQIAGTAQWRRDASLPAGALSVRLARLNIPDTSDDGHAADAMAGSINELPALDLVADQFVLRGHDFGKLEVKAHTSHTGNEPVWTLEKLSIEQPGATLTGSGSWRLPRRLRAAASASADSAYPAAGRRTLLDFKLDIRDAGAVLERMGLPHTLRDGNGSLEGRVAWRGSPLSIDYPTLSGRLSLKLENGQILSVDPGAARLLGVLSLQSLLRFATLDFRTVASRGTVFDDMSGTGTVENGVGTIQEFRLKSSQVMATMTGSANLLRETQDLDVTVVPRINATTTSVAAAFINPVLGIGTLAAQLLFADEFSKVFTQHYRVTGAWANPQVTKVEDNTSAQPPLQDHSGDYPR